MGCHFEYVPRISLNTWVLTSLKSNVAKFALLTLCEEMQSVISFMAILCHEQMGSIHNCPDSNQAT